MLYSRLTWLNTKKCHIIKALPTEQSKNISPRRKNESLPHCNTEIYLKIRTCKSTDLSLLPNHCSYNKRQGEAQFLKFIWQSTLHVSERLTVHHQEYLTTVYTAIGICHASSVGCLLAWSRWACSSILTTLADANTTSTTNTYCLYTVLRYSWWWTVNLSETFRVLYQINLRNSASSGRLL